MGKKDEVLRKYLADNKRYADLINGFALNGQQIIKAEDIFALDSRTEVKNRTKEKSKYRDAIRCTAFGTNFAVIGVENQNEVDYLMPLRCMGYDVREYERQAAMWRKQVRCQKKITGAEFLSGFRKCDRLHPCITFVLYYGDEWDGSRDLVGMLDCQGMPEELRMLVNNYKIHLIDVKRLENTEVFQTDLRQVFDFVRFSGDKNKLRELSSREDVYMEMDEDAYDVAVAFTGAEELVSLKKKEGGSMCQALKELLKEEREEGREEGRDTLLQRQIKKKIAKGKKIEQIAEELEETVESIREYYDKLVV